MMRILVRLAGDLVFAAACAVTCTVVIGFFVLAFIGLAGH